MTQPFPFLLLPHAWASRNRVRRREKGDALRGIVFGTIGVLVSGALFYGAYWVTSQLAAYEEFGDYLLRLGLSWLFLSFLAFLGFSGVVTALSTFFLSEDLRQELSEVTLPFTSETPSESELRIAQAQLVGWLEGLFHGIQATLFTQQMNAQKQFEEMRGRRMLEGGDPRPTPGAYL